MDVVTSDWFQVCKVIVVVFVNLLIFLILFKNDNVEWITRAFSFYNLRSADGYDYISSIPERNDKWDDVVDSSRTTTMERRFASIANDDDSVRFLISDGIDVYDGGNNDLGLVFF